MKVKKVYFMALTFTLNNLNCVVYAWGRLIQAWV